jgi:hypothetical protein
VDYDETTKNYKYNLKFNCSQYNLDLKISDFNHIPKNNYMSKHRKRITFDI